MKTIYSRVERSQELSFYVAEFALDDLKHFELGKVHTAVDFDFDTELSRNLLIIHLSVEVSYDERMIVLAHNCIFEFLVPELASFMAASGQLEKEMVQEFVYESYALARGMISVRTLGFGVHDYPLPFLAKEKILEKLDALAETPKDA